MKISKGLSRVLVTAMLAMFIVFASILAVTIINLLGETVTGSVILLIAVIAALIWMANDIRKKVFP